MRGSRCVHASHALHAPVATRIHVVLSPAAGAAHAVMPTTTPEGNSRRHGRVAPTGAGAFRVPRAQPFASTEFRSAGAVLRLSPRGDRMHPVLLLPLRAGTLRWRGPVPACLAQHPVGTENSYNALSLRPWSRFSVSAHRWKSARFGSSGTSCTPGAETFGPARRRRVACFQRERDRGRSDVLSARVPARPRHLGCG